MSKEWFLHFPGRQKIITPRSQNSTNSCAHRPFALSPRHPFCTFSCHAFCASPSAAHCLFLLIEWIFSSKSKKAKSCPNPDDKKPARKNVPQAILHNASYTTASFQR